MEIHCTNPNQGYATFLRRLKLDHATEESRNGLVWVCPEPLVVTYTNPLERVLFSPLRDANPWLHLLGDALWCIAGRRDLAWPAFFAGNMKNYSDDGETLHGAYGFRWRKAFMLDQLSEVANLLVKEPTTRRAVLAMWTPEDLALCGAREKVSKDVPCNLNCCFDLRGGTLNLTVFNRSNDCVWGLFGTNVVQFSLLQELLAAWVGAPVGVYNQVTNNAHVYTNTIAPERFDELAMDAEIHDEYYNQDIKHFPLVQSDAEQWLRELDRFMLDPMNEKHAEYSEDFFPGVAIPMYRAWWLRKQGHAPHEVTLAAKDWEIVCNSWLKRHNKKNIGWAHPRVVEEDGSFL